MPSIKEILKNSSNRLRSVAQNPQKEAMTLLAYSLHVEIVWLLTHENRSIDIPKNFLEYLEKRLDCYPLEYIVKSTSFYSKEFYTDERVLIPRPETEILIDQISSTCRAYKKPHVVEIGTGSGIISVVLATLFPDAKITATDISEDALEVAKINAKRYGVSDKIKFLNCNLLDGVGEKIDILVSNPPYIKIGEKLDKNLSYEPDLALFGGEKGDEILKQIIDEFIKRKASLLACEMGYDQKEKILNYLRKYNLEAKFYRDLAGIDRGFVVKNLR